MPHSISVTLDMEDLRPTEDFPERVIPMTKWVLDLLAEFKVRASIYVVADLAKRRPELVHQAAVAGHEIGLHGHTHTPLPLLERQQFKTLTCDARHLLQDISGQEVRGYRAPMMSLTPASAWAIPILSELGFSYSSSTLPASSPLYGWPGLPRQAFRWSNGLIELPCPLVRIFFFEIPYLGGTYLRLLPSVLHRIGHKRSRPEEILWTYFHPWEFDTEEKYYRQEFIGSLANRLAWLGRRRHTTAVAPDARRALV